MTDLRQAAQQAVDACEQRLPLNGQAAIIDELNNLRTALEQQAEPVETYIHAYRSQPHPNDFGIPKGHWWKAKQYADALYTTPPQPLAQPISFAGLTLTEVRVPFGMTFRFEGSALVVETVHNVKEGKTPAFISCDAHGNILSKERNNG